MSLGGPKIPNPVAPAAEPPRPDESPAQQQLGAEEASSENLKRKKKGRNALRIDPQHGGSGVAPGQTGVNVPS
jgi:hypothetical protein